MTSGGISQKQCEVDQEPNLLFCLNNQLSGTGDKRLLQNCVRGKAQNDTFVSSGLRSRAMCEVHWLGAYAGRNHMKQQQQQQRAAGERFLVSEACFMLAEAQINSFRTLKRSTTCLCLLSLSPEWHHGDMVVHHTTWCPYLRFNVDQLFKDHFRKS